MKAHRKHRSGFTLIEIMIVISIITVLSGIVYTLGKSLITHAKVVESTTNLRSLAIANTVYASDYGVFCPADSQSNNRRWHGSRSSTNGKFDPTTGFLAPYLGQSMRVTTCPLFKDFVKNSESFEDGTGGYGYNAVYIGGKPGAMFDNATKLRISENTLNLPDPGKTVMFTTTAYARATGLQEYPYCEPPYWDFGSGPTGQRPTPSVHFRANGKALVAWCDGHVTAESKTSGASGTNLHDGNDEKSDLGWFGPTDRNGYWNPKYSSPE